MKSDENSSTHITWVNAIPMPMWLTRAIIPSSSTRCLPPLPPSLSPSLRPPLLEYTVFRAFRPLDNDETVVGVVVACYLTRVASLDRTFALARSLGLVRSSGPVSNDARRTVRPTDRPTDWPKQRPHGNSRARERHAGAQRVY